MILKKSLFILLICICLFSLTALPIFATNYNISSYSLSSTYVDYLSGILNDYSGDYLLFRSGQYSYCLAISDSFSFDENTGLISGSDVDVITLSTSAYSSSDYTVFLNHEESFSSTYSNQMIYSSFIRGVPSLTHSNQLNYPLILIALIVSIVFFVISIISYFMRGF